MLISRLGAMPDMGAMSPAPAVASNGTVSAAAPPTVASPATAPLAVAPPGTAPPAVGQQGAMAAAAPAGMALPSVPNVRRRW